MTRLKHLILKNRMLLANGVINTLGLIINRLLLMNADVPIPGELLATIRIIDLWFIPLALLTGLTITGLYERPIREYLDHLYQKTDVPAPLLAKARQRLLNEPFVLIAMDVILWLAAAVIHAACFNIINASACDLDRTFFSVLNTGLMTVTVAFFAFEYIMQRLHAPYFFPDGGLYSTDRTLKIRIRTRLVALLFGCNLIPFLSILQIFREMLSSGLDPATVLQHLDSAIVPHVVVFMLVGAWLTFLVTSNLTRSLKDIIKVLKSIQQGNFDTRVNVTSNDEIGYAGDVINQMTDGLKERDRIRHALNLAGEIQQRLLPRHDPDIPGLDIAGRSIYCDETGGDYYDYLDLGNGDNSNRRVGIVVGDVSDHGISSALLMATARASLRQRVSLGGNPDAMINDINRQLSRDIGNSGQFMTLFLAVIEVASHRLSWIRAGHEPGMMYDPATDHFEILRGPGAALGIDDTLTYTACRAPDFTCGKILLLGTDGIWEARNKEGLPFGKDAISTIIRKHHTDSAHDLNLRIVETLGRFLGQSPLEDDITLVIIKKTGE